MMDDSPYPSVNDSMTSLANDFLEVKTKSITKNAENFAMVLLWIKWLEPDDRCIQDEWLLLELRNIVFKMNR